MSICYFRYDIIYIYIYTRYKIHCKISLPHIHISIVFTIDTNFATFSTDNVITITD